MNTQSKTPHFADGEVIGTDNDACLIAWDASIGAAYNCGESLADYGAENLSDVERVAVTRKSAPRFIGVKSNGSVMPFPRPY